MASKIVPAGSKRPGDPATQGLNIKFVINVPLKVDSEDQAKTRCCYLLRTLTEDVRKEDLEDIAIIFGMNGKHTPELNKVLEKLKSWRCNCNLHPVKHSIITYTWGSGGMIAQSATEPPFQDIREHLKNNPATTKLVEELRGKNKSCLVYFSFVDSDTIWFNSIYSEYLQIVEKELEKDKIPPTVMSTGYRFHGGSEHHIAGWLDRMLRTALAEVNPLFVYFPEPNFCVLVHDKLNTIEESFIDRRRTNMESAVLISRVKKRDNFKAVFSFDRNAIIIDVPDRFKLSGKGLITGQSCLEGMNLAVGANCHKVLTHKSTMQGIAGKNRGFIMRLFNCKSDEEFKKISENNPFEGEEGEKLIKAIKEARECKNFIYEFDEKLPAD